MSLDLAPGQGPEALARLNLDDQALIWIRIVMAAFEGTIVQVVAPGEVDEIFGPVRGRAKPKPIQEELFR